MTEMEQKVKELRHAVQQAKRELRAVAFEAPVKIICGMGAGLATGAILVGGFVTWVWFVAECVKLATLWGWLP